MSVVGLLAALMMLATPLWAPHVPQEVRRVVSSSDYHLGAVAFTVLTQGHQETPNASSYQTASVTITAGQPVLMAVGSAVFSGVGATAEATLQVPSGVTSRRVFHWGLNGDDGPRAQQHYLLTGSGTGQVTIDFAGAQVQDECHWHLIEITGDVDASDPLVQIQGSTQNSFENSITPAIAMDPFNNATNGTLAFGFKGSNAAVTPEAGWTKLSEELSATIYGSTVLGIASNDTSVTATWGGDAVHAIWIAYEVGRTTPGTANVYSTPRGASSAGSGSSRATDPLLRLRANHLALIWVFNSVSSGIPASVTPSTVGDVLTFTQIDQEQNPGTRQWTCWRVAVGPTDFVGAITFTADGGASQQAWGWIVNHARGVALTGTNGADAIGDHNAGTGSGSTSFAVNLPAPPADYITVLGLVHANQTITTTAEAGFDVIDNQLVVSPIGYRMFVEQLTSEDASPSVTFSANATTVGIALALVPASAPAPTAHTTVVLIEDD